MQILYIAVLTFTFLLVVFSSLESFAQVDNTPPVLSKTITPNSLVTTTAGSNISGDVDGPALNATFNDPFSVAEDSQNNLYIADTFNNKIRILYTNGTVSTIAGTGAYGNTDGPALNAKFNRPMDIIFDPIGNLYIADTFNNKIRILYTNGTVSTIAGTGAFNSTDGPALNATFYRPFGIVFDPIGNLYIADSYNHKIRVLYQNGTVSTVAGNGSRGSADGSALNATFNNPYGLTFDTMGNLYLTDYSNHKIRVLYQNGTVSTIAGTGAFSSTDGSALNATFVFPYDVMFDSKGNLFITEFSDSGIRVLYQNGTVSTLSGNSISGSVNGPVSNTTITAPKSLLFNAAGDLYITISNSIRKISATSQITLNKGTGSLFIPFSETIDVSSVNLSRIFLGDYNLISLTGSTIKNIVNDSQITITLTESQRQNVITQTILQLDIQQGAVVDLHSNEITQSLNNSVSVILDTIEPSLSKNKINSDSIVTTITGSSTRGVKNGPALNATFTSIYHATFDSKGDLYIADSFNNRIRILYQNGTVSTIAGSFLGRANGPALNATFTIPSYLLFDPIGNLYISDTRSHLIRILHINGTVTTFAGSFIGYSEGPALNARFGYPLGIEFDSIGNLYVAEYIGQRIRIIYTNGTVSTIAGNSSTGSTDGPAMDARFNWPHDVKFDSYGNLYILDSFNSKIRILTPDGIVSTIAGTGARGSADGLALNATFNYPFNFVFDSDGNLYITDLNNYKIRILYTNGTVSTIAGNGSRGLTDGPVSNATFFNPRGIFFDSLDNLYVTDHYSIRKISAQLPISLDKGTGKLVLRFSETIDTTSINLSRIFFNVNDSILTSTNLNNTLNSSQITIYLTETQRQNVIATSLPQLNILQGAIHDTSNNSILELLDNTLTTIPDTIKPTFFLATVNLSIGDFVIKFSETIDISSVNLSKIFISDINQTNQILLQGANLSTINSTTLNLTLTPTLRQSVIALSSHQLGILQGAVSDTSNNTILESLNNIEIIADSLSPRFISSSINLSTGLLDITFSETIDNSSLDPSKIFINDINQTNQISLNTNQTIFINNTNITLFLTESQRQDVITLSIPQLDILQGAIHDRSNNSILESLDNTIQITTDSIAPRFIVSSVNLSIGVLDITFSETIDNSLIDLSKIFISDINQTNQISLYDSTQTTSINSTTFGIKLTPILRQSVIALSSPQLDILQGSVYDTTGNAILESSNNNLIIMGDSITPIFNSASVNLSTGLLDITFSEAISPLQLNLSLFLIHDTSLVNNFVLSDANLITLTSNNLILNLTESQRQQIILLSMPQIDILSMGVYDTTGNSITDSLSNTIVVFNDTTSPKVKTLLHQITNISTVAGSHASGFTDGSSTDALFRYLRDLVFDSQNNLYIADWYNNKIRILYTNGTVSTIAGNGNRGDQDGQALNAEFNRPEGLALDSVGNLYIADTLNHKIKILYTNGTVSTIAGNGTVGDKDGQGTSATFHRPGNLLVDSSGNLFISEIFGHKIRILYTNGTVSTIIGRDGSSENVGSGITDAKLSFPQGLELDSVGNLYIADSLNHEIKILYTNGTVSTIAGNGTSGSQDGFALDSTFNMPTDLEFDSFGNLYIADTFNHKLRVLYTNGTVSTIAGNGTVGNNNGPLDNAVFNRLRAIAFDSNHDLYIANTNAHTVKVIPSTLISQIFFNKGTGILDIIFTETIDALSVNLSRIFFSETGAINEISLVDSTATSTDSTLSITLTESQRQDVITLSIPQLDILQGAIHDTSNNSILESLDNTITTIPDTIKPIFFLATVNQSMGNFTITFSETIDNSLIDLSKIFISDINQTNQISLQNSIQTTFTNSTILGLTLTPDQRQQAIALSLPQLDILQGAIHDTSNNSILESLDNTIQITTDSITPIFNSASVNLSTGLLDITFSEAISPLQLNLSLFLIHDTSLVNNFVLSDANLITLTSNNLILNLTESQRQQIILLSMPQIDILSMGVYDTTGNSITDSLSNTIVVFNDTTSPKVKTLLHQITNISTVAGSHASGFTDGSSTDALFRYLRDLVFDSQNNLYIADWYNNKIRILYTNGTVSTIAGNGNRGDQDGQALNAEFNRPEGLALDSVGNLYIADTLNHKIKILYTNGTVSTIAGNGTVGDKDGQGTSATFHRPGNLLVDSSGNLFISEIFGHKIRILYTNGTVSTIIGRDGSSENVGSGITDAKLSFPQGLELDSVGNLYIADSLNHEIKILYTNGTVSTIAGNGTSGSQDGFALDSTFNMPTDLEFDSFGNLYIADTFNHKLRVLYTNGTVSTIAGNGTVGNNNGPLDNAVFNRLRAIAFDSNHDLYIANTNAHTVKIIPSTLISQIFFNKGTGILDIIFTETIDALSVNLSRIFFSETGAINEISLVDSTATSTDSTLSITLTESQRQDVITLSIPQLDILQGAIHDTSNNSILESLDNTITTIPDTIKPIFFLATVNQSMGNFTITFSETIDNSLIDLSKIFISDINQTNQISLQNSIQTTFTNSTILGLTLTPDQRQQAIALSLPQLDILQGAIHDTSNNSILESLDNTIQITTDSITPIFNSASVNLSTGLLDITFSETIDNSSVDLSRIFFSETGGINEISLVDSTATSTDSTLSITLTESQRQDVITLSIPQLDILQGAIHDTSNNSILESLDNTITTIPDTIKPIFFLATVNQSMGNFTITFSETIDNSLIDLSKIFISDINQTNQISLQNSIQTTFTNSTILGLTLTPDQRQQAIALSLPQLDILQGAIHDTSNNSILESLDNTIQITTDSITPIFNSASVNLSTGLLDITFSELIDNSLIDLSKIFISDINQTNQISLQDSTQITTNNKILVLILTEAQRQSVINISTPQLNIQQGAVYDTTGNAILESLDNNLVRIEDSVTPKFISSSVNLSTGLLDITFSETIDNSSVDLSRIFFSETGAINEISLVDSAATSTDSTLSITLTESQRQDVITLSIPQLDILQGAIHDTSNNSILESLDNTITTIPDTIKPIFFLATVNQSMGNFTITFSETIDNSLIDLSKIFISDINQTNQISLQNSIQTTFTNSTILGLTLTPDQRQQAIALSLPQLDILQGAIHDTSNNSILESLDNTIQITTDSITPIFNSASVNLSTGLLDITFSELIDNSLIDLSKIFISDINQTNQISLQDSTQITTNNKILVLILTEAQRQSVINISTPQLNIQQGAVYDTTGNAILESLDNNLVRIEDSVTPKFISSSVNLSTGLLDITFSETIDNSSVDLSRIFFSETGAINEISLVDSAATSTDSTLSITLTESQRQDVITLSIPQLDILQGAIHDTSNNSILESLDNTITTIPDTIKPIFFLATVNQSMGNFTITFSETIDNSLIDLSKIFISDINQTNQISLQNSIQTTFTNSTILGLTLTPDQRQQAIALSLPQLDILQGAIHDTSNNSILESLDNTIQITTDSITPIFNSASVNLSTGLLDITFSETIDNSSVDLSRIFFSETGGINEISLVDSTATSTDSTLSITLTESQRQDVITLSIPQLDILQGAIHDTSNNSILESLDNPITTIPDTIKPIFFLATVNQSMGNFTITFSETIDNSLIDLSKIFISDINQTNQISLQNSIQTTFTNSTILGLTLTPDQRQQAIALSLPQLDILQGAIHDTSNNSILESLDNTIQITTDSITPIFNSASVNLSTGLLDITFSETIDNSSVDLSRIFFSETGGINEISLVDSTATSTDSTLSITLTESQRQDVITLSIPQLDILQGAIHDTSNNSILESLDNPITTIPDTIIPTFVSALESQYFAVYTIGFDEKIDISSVNLSRMFISSSNSIQIILEGANLITSVNDASITIILTESQRQSVNNFTILNLDIISGAVADLQGNVISTTLGNRIQLSIEKTLPSIFYKITDESLVTTVAGYTNFNDVDGPALSARFAVPNGLAFDDMENLYIADRYNHKIKILYINGTVDTIAGTGIVGSTDGSASSATFFNPVDVVFDSLGNLYIADLGNNKIRILYTNGTISTIAGIGSRGSTDGLADTATFFDPEALAFNSKGDLYIADSSNYKIRVLYQNGTVSTVAGTGTIGSTDGLADTATFYHIRGIAFDSMDNLYITDSKSYKIRVLYQNGTVSTVAGTGTIGSTDGLADTATFTSPDDLVFDSSGNLYFIDNSNHKIRVLYTNGTVSTIAGKDYPGGTDGPIQTATFDQPYGLEFDTSGNLYVSNFHAIRNISANPTITLNKITADLMIQFTKIIDVSNIDLSKIHLTTFGFDIPLSGASLSTITNNDIIIIKLTESQYQSVVNLDRLNLDIISGAVADLQGNVISTTLGNKIKLINDPTPPSIFYKITDESLVTTVAGYTNFNDVDGPALSARFAVPNGLAFDDMENLYIADRYNHKIKILYINGTVDTIAGTGIVGSTDGSASSATFFNPVDVVFDSLGNLYIADLGNNKIRILYTNGTISTIAGIGSRGSTDGLADTATFFDPEALAFNSKGDLYIADSSNYKIRVLYQNGTVSTVAGTGTIGSTDGLADTATFYHIRGIAFDSMDNLYITDSKSYKIRVLYQNGTVSTVAGTGTIGSTDGLADTATFTSPDDLVFDSSGNLYFIDNSNHKIRVLYTNGTVSTIAGKDYPGGTDGPIQTATFDQPYGLEFDTSGNLYVSNFHAIRNISANPTITLNKITADLMIQFTKIIDVSNIDLSKIHLTTFGFDIPLSGASLSTITNNDIIIIKLTESQRQSVNNFTILNLDIISGAVADLQGNVISTTLGNRIQLSIEKTLPSIFYKITDESLVTTVAGYTNFNDVDGPALSARFAVPNGLAFDDMENLYIADRYNHKIKILYINGTVDTIAGTGIVGSTDGSASSATFFNPVDVVFDSLGNLYIADLGNNKIRILYTNGTISTIAGIGSRGSTDGLADTATFFDPEALAFNSKGDLYIADSSNYKIRVLYQNGTVSTVAGTGTIGSTDGLADTATFYHIRGIAFDSMDNLYITDSKSYKIRVLYQNGTVSTVAGTGTIGSTDGLADTATFTSPDDLVFDSSGNLYFIDNSNHKIRVLYTNGTVSTIAGKDYPGGTDGPIQTATFDQPYGLEFDTSGNLYVSNFHAIRNISANPTITLNKITADLMIQFTKIIDVSNIDLSKIHLTTFGFDIPLSGASLSTITNNDIIIIKLTESQYQSVVNLDRLNLDIISGAVADLQGNVISTTLGNKIKLINDPTQ